VSNLDFYIGRDSLKLWAPYTPICYLQRQRIGRLWIITNSPCRKLCLTHTKYCKCIQTCADHSGAALWSNYEVSLCYRLNIFTISLTTCQMNSVEFPVEMCYVLMEWLYTTITNM